MWVSFQIETNHTQMDTRQNLLKDKFYIIGLSLLAISTTVFILPELLASKEISENFGIFFFHHIITFIYFIMMLVTGKLKRASTNLPHVFLFMLIFLVSAYSLNRNIPVFEISVNWVCVALVIYSLTYIAIAFLGFMGNFLKHTVSFILGSAILFFLYLTFYCMPLMPLSLIAFFLLGLSLHTFVPLLFVIFTLIQVNIMRHEKRAFGWSVISGFALSFLVAVLFAFQWNAIDNSVNKSFQKSLIADNADLPSWAKVAQHFPKNWASERYLKSNLVYSTAENGLSDRGFGMPSKNLNETRKHDPLVMFASFCITPQRISNADKIKVLEAVYDARHNTQERLWNGQNLHTAAVISNIKIWPGLRLAYTEKTITVSNNNPQHNFWDREKPSIPSTCPRALLSRHSLYG